jgi:hypothetical protein
MRVMGCTESLCSYTHRYLIPRLSLKVVNLCRHVSSTAPPFILWWWNLETLFAPLLPQLSLHRRAALSSYSNGTRSYLAERTQSAVYIVRYLWVIPHWAMWTCLNKAWRRLCTEKSATKVPGAPTMIKKQAKTRYCKKRSNISRNVRNLG